MIIMSVRFIEFTIQYTLLSKKLTLTAKLVSTLEDNLVIQILFNMVFTLVVDFIQVFHIFIAEKK